MPDKPSIFIVDDDKELCKNTAEFLGAHGFAVQCFYNASSLVDKLYSKQCDLLLLDIMLPGLNGFELYKLIKAQHEIKVIFVSALGEETDRVLGLELGADDYLVKPFYPRELLARVKNALRKSEAVEKFRQLRAYHFEGWTLEVKRRLLTDADGLSNSLSAAEFRLLRHFLEHPQQTASREALLEVLDRSEDLANNKVLDMQISRLRQILGERARSARLILTSRGDGYIFAADVEKEYVD